MASNSWRKSTMKSTIFVTAVSMTPLWQKTISKVSPHTFCVKVIGIMQDNLPLKGARATRVWGTQSQRCHICTVVSMTPLCLSQQCQWHRNQLCQISLQIRSHIRKGFNLCIRDPGEVVWWKKQRSKISCQGPFNESSLVELAAAVLKVRHILTSPV
jgi:hypothetical protein